jgi:hypothetical protein
MKSRYQKKLRHRRRRNTRKRQRGGTLAAPSASIVQVKQDPYSSGTLMSLEDALEFKTNDPIRF